MTSSMPDGDAVAAGYRSALLREQRIHATLGIPWQVSDAVRSYLVLLPGLPGMDAQPSSGGVQVKLLVSARETWTISEMTAWARDALGFTRAEIAGALGVTATTVARWERGDTAPRGGHRSQFDALQDLRALLETVFATPAHATTWLRRSPDIRDAVSPLTMIATGAITPLVGVLASLEAGAFL